MRSSVKTKEMRYRIKIKTFESNRKEFTAQVKVLFGWKTLDHQGGKVNYGSITNKRKYALERIDLHVAGNSKPDTVEFEYITR